MTSIQIDIKVLGELAKVAERDLDGVSLSEAVHLLIVEHRFTRVTQRYDELRSDPEEWASYGLSDAREEYPEYNPLPGFKMATRCHLFELARHAGLRSFDSNVGKSAYIS